MAAMNGRPVQRAPPPAPAAPTRPRRFFNTNGTGAAFDYYYHESKTAIIYFDPVSEHGSNFLPTIYEKQTFQCLDGSRFVFYPDGTGTYTNAYETKGIPLGTFSWTPPPPVVLLSPAAPPAQAPTPRLERPAQQAQEEDDEETHRRWKYGLS